MGAALVRIAVIWMPSDQMLENGGLPFEEVMRGNAADDILRGTLLPLTDYQTNHFSGGSLVIAILAVPFFLVGGTWFPVLRLVSLCFSLPLVLLTFLLVDRWGGRRAAWCATLLIAFAPPGYQFLNCTVYGTHLEGNLVTVALVYGYLRWRSSGRRGRIGVLLFGVASGFAVWFGYGQCVTVAVLAAVELAASGWRFVLGFAPAYVLGFLVGFSPWIAHMLRHPGRALQIYDQSLAAHFDFTTYVHDKLHLLGQLIVEDAPRSFWMHDVGRPFGYLLALVLYGAVLGLLASSTWIERHRLIGFARALLRGKGGFDASLRLISLAFISLWLCALALSDFVILSATWVQGCRYLMPLVPFLVILAGLAVQEARRPATRLLGTAVMIGIPFVDTLATWAQIRPDRMRQHASAPAASWTWHVRMISRRYGSDADAMLEVLKRIEERRTDPERSQLVEGIATAITSIAASGLRPSEAMDLDTSPFSGVLAYLADHAPESQRPVFARRLAELNARRDSR